MRNSPFTLCVVGAGFTGAAAAIACLNRIARPFSLVVIGSSAALGRGVAYGADHPLHLLNVRTRDLSVRAGQPGDFLNWAFRQLDQGENHPGLHEGLAHTFLPRQLFGEYVRQRFFEAVEQRSDVDFRLANGAAAAIAKSGEKFVVSVDNGERVEADALLLATAYGLARSSAEGALPPYTFPRGGISGTKSVTLIGSGLSMVDVFLEARRDGYQGKINIISPRGLLPRPHASKGVVPQELALPRSKRISSLTGSVALACAAAEAHGTPWQAIVNGLRASLQDIWLGLSLEERARFLRHVRPLWDVHRHRLPIEVHARLMSDLGDGSAVLIKGRVANIDRGPSGFTLTLRRPGFAAPERLETELAFDCTGHKPDLGSPLIQSLLQQGLARQDPHGLGLAVERNGQILAGGGVTRGLYALGPLCQGSLWEITAVPEIVAQCAQAAESIAASAEAPALAPGPAGKRKYG